MVVAAVLVPVMWSGLEVVKTSNSKLKNCNESNFTSLYLTFAYSHFQPSPPPAHLSSRSLFHAEHPGVCAVCQAAACPQQHHLRHHGKVPGQEQAQGTATHLHPSAHERSRSVMSTRQASHSALETRPPLLSSFMGCCLCCSLLVSAGLGHTQLLCFAADLTPRCTGWHQQLQLLLDLCIPLPSFNDYMHGPSHEHTGSTY